MNSKQYKKQIEDNLNQLLYDFDNLLYYLENELKQEIVDKKEIAHKRNEEAIQVYSMLDEELCIKLIKKCLPLKVKLFNKITSNGKHCDNDIIGIDFCFNDDLKNTYTKTFRYTKVKELLKI